MQPSAAFRRIAAAALLTLTAACGSPPNDETVYPTKQSRRDPQLYKQGSIFGSEGLKLFGNDKQDPSDPGGAVGIGVNTFLWRASLDTVGFMPLASADPFGGVIITDWYTPPEAPGERFKMNVYILDRQLRADGVRVAVFRQQQASVGWVDSSVAPGTATDIENKILQRARELRVQAGPTRS